MKTMVNTAVIAALVLMSGCSTIVTPEHKGVHVSSATEGQEFEVINSEGIKITKGTTPTTVILSNKGDSSYTYKTPCNTRIEDSELNGWIFGNILFGGIIGIAVDLIDGYSNKPNDEVFINNCDTKIATKPEDETSKDGA